MNNLNKIFQKNLMNSSNNFILGVYIIYLIISAFSSIAFCFLYIQKFPNIIDSNYNLILKNIGFLFGDLIQNLYNHNTYSFKAENDIIFHLRRLPALVFVIFSLYSLCKNFFFIIISKNIILYSLYFLIIYKSLKIKNKKKNILFFILLIFVPVIVPYNYLVSLNFTFEDCLITLFLPLLYFLLIFNYVPYSN